jgi:hypothetical protein
MTPAGVSPERRGNTDGHWLVAPMARPSQVLRRPAAAVFAAAVILMLALAPGSFFGLPEPDFPAASINPDLMKTADRTVPGEVRELASAPRITSDLADYAPGATAVIVIDAVDEGATVAFEVDHVADPGADGVWGTLDDVTVQLGGAGHDPWFVTDGSDGDLDGVADGKLSTSWHVNPDDSLDQRFLLTGQVVDAGSNCAFGTDGDVRARRIASNTFTDSGGDYTIDFSAGNPLEYQKVRPADLTSFPAGRQSEPIPGALDSTATEALSPVGMALGQIVPFIFNISMGAKKGAAATGDIQITAAWSTTLTNGGAFGYDPDFGVVAAFIDGLDPGDQRWRLAGDRLHVAAAGCGGGRNHQHRPRRRDRGHGHGREHEPEDLVDPRGLGCAPGRYRRRFERQRSVNAGERSGDQRHGRRWRERPRFHPGPRQHRQPDRAAEPGAGVLHRRCGRLDRQVGRARRHGPRGRR